MEEEERSMDLREKIRAYEAALKEFQNLPVGDKDDGRSVQQTTDGGS